MAKINTNAEWAPVTTVGELAEALNEQIPPELAEDWDHVGLQLGSGSQPVRTILLSLDYDNRAAESARMAGAELVITHHPPFFNPVYGLNDATPDGKRLYQAARDSLCLFAMHTNLDVAAGGVSDQLAAVLGLKVEGVLRSLDTDLPVEKLQGLAKADLPRYWGQGRIGRFENNLNHSNMLRRVNNRLKTAGVVCNFDTTEPCGLTLVSGGSWDASWLPYVLDAKVKTVISGEMRHHEMLDLADYGIYAVAAGHAATERVVLPALRDWLQERWPDLDIAVNMGLDYNQLVY